MAEKGSSRKRNDLFLKMKYEVIKTVEREQTIGSRKLAETFQCSRTQIQTILKNKDTIKDARKEQENLSTLTSIKPCTSGTSLQLHGAYTQMERF